MMNIIAFSGKKQSGKTTAVDDIMLLVTAMGIQVVALNFADKLKEIVLDLFIPQEWEWGIDELNDNKTKKLPMGMDVRGCLQWFGTDVCRAKYPDIWVNAVNKKLNWIKGNYAEDVVILVGDVRFPNEVRAVQEGGHVIRLLRNPHNDQHESETALDVMTRSGALGPSFTIAERNPLYRLVWAPEEGFDAIIDNCEMSIAEQNEAVWKLVTEQGWIKKEPIVPALRKYVDGKEVCSPENEA